ncbi:DUF2332 family protein, partial [Aeromicrobium sp.]|uniref:DUF2332 family protein n=1 Tax=Aeromicrobium sp. TaxID=1871063 RepID=UPI0019918ABE
IDVARKTPPQVTCGDLLEVLPEQVDIARKYGEVVGFHCAVIAYLDLEERAEFQAMMLRLVNDGACRWVSNESKRVLPDIASSGPTIPNELSTFVLGLDGQAVAWTHGHGTSMKWVQANRRVG